MFDVHTARLLIQLIPWKQAKAYKDSDAAASTDRP